MACASSSAWLGEKTRRDCEPTISLSCSSLMRRLPSKLMTLIVGYSLTRMVRVRPWGRISTVSNRPDC